MQKQTFIKFFIPILIISSIFAGPFYNLLTFLNIWVLESHWSIYFDAVLFANLMALCFLIFTILFIIVIRYIDKAFNEQLIVLCFLLTGFCCIYASLIWVWEIVVLVFLLASGTTAYLIPTLGKYTSNILQKRNEKRQFKIILPVGVVIWLFISYVLFYFLGGYWRFLYLITGVINVLSSLLFIFI